MNSSALSYISALRLDPYPTPDYQVIHTESDLSSYFFGPQYLDSITSSTPGESLTACDTESTPDHLPYCITFSCYPGTGRLIYRHDTNLIHLLKQYLETSSLLLFHNYLHDVHPFSYLGIPIPIHSFRDTMILAYNACLGGGGSDDDSDSPAGRGSLSLKSLAYRHCNMSMTSFRDTVYPHSVPYLLTYLKSISDSLFTGPDLPTCECTHLRSLHLDRGPTGKLKGACTYTLCPCSRYKLTSTKKSEDDKLLGLLKRKTDKLISDISIHPSYSYDLDESEEEELYPKRIRNSTLTAASANGTPTTTNFWVCWKVQSPSRPLPTYPRGICWRIRAVIVTPPSASTSSSAPTTLGCSTEFCYSFTE